MSTFHVTTEDPYEWEEQKPRIVVTMTGSHVGETVTIAYTQDKAEVITKLEALIVEAQYALARVQGMA